MQRIKLGEKKGKSRLGERGGGRKKKKEGSSAHGDRVGGRTVGEQDFKGGGDLVSESMGRRQTSTKGSENQIFALRTGSRKGGRDQVAGTHKGQKTGRGKEHQRVQNRGANRRNSSQYSKSRGSQGRTSKKKKKKVSGGRPIRRKGPPEERSRKLERERGFYMIREVKLREGAPSKGDSRSASWIRKKNWEGRLVAKRTRLLARQALAALRDNRKRDTGKRKAKISPGALGSSRKGTCDVHGSKEKRDGAR